MGFPRVGEIIVGATQKQACVRAPRRPPAQPFLPTIEAYAFSEKWDHADTPNNAWIFQAIRMFESQVMQFPK